MWKLALFVLLFTSLSSACFGARPTTRVEVISRGVKAVGRVNSVAHLVPDSATSVEVDLARSSFAGTTTNVQFGADVSLDGGQTWSMLVSGLTHAGEFLVGPIAATYSGVSTSLPAGTGRLLRGWIEVEGRQIDTKLDLEFSE
jgi:hypothetical protein